MHLQKMEAAGLVTSSLELSEDEKAMKGLRHRPFDIRITPEVIVAAASTLTVTKKSAVDSEETS